MSNNEFITLPSCNEMVELRDKITPGSLTREINLPVTSGEGSLRLMITEQRPFELRATAFAQHTGLATINADNTTACTENWLRHKGERDTVMACQIDSQGHHDLAPRKVDEATLGVMPVLLNGDQQPFGTTTAQDGQTNLLIGKGLPRFPQSGVDANTAADLDCRLDALQNVDDRHPTPIGLAVAGSYTAPDTGRPMPCYRFRGQYYVQHTNADGHTAWFRCDPITVKPLANNRIGVPNALFAAPFSNRHNFRTRTQGVMVNDELTLSQFALGRYLQDVFLPELVKSTVLDKTHPVDKIAFVSPKLSRLNVTFPRENNHDWTK